MKVNVLVEGRRDAYLIGAFFFDRLPDLEPVFFASEGRNPALLGSGLLQDSSLPLLIVCDAETQRPELLAERRELVEFNLGFAAPSNLFKVFLVRPETEVVFFEIPGLDIGKVNPLVLAKEGPRAALEPWLDEERFSKLIDQIRSENLWDHSPQMRELETQVRDFVNSLTRTKPPLLPANEAKEKAPA